MLMTGTQTTMSSGWIIRYLFDFARALPERCEIHHAAEESSAEEDEAGEEAKKREIDQDPPQDLGSQGKATGFEMDISRSPNNELAARWKLLER